MSDSETLKYREGAAGGDRKAQQGLLEALAKIFREKKLYRRDLIPDALTAMFEAFEDKRYKPDISAEDYMFGILRMMERKEVSHKEKYKVTKSIRPTERQRMEDKSTGGLGPLETAIAREVEAKIPPFEEIMKEVADIIATEVPDEYRELMRLKIVENKENSEICKILGKDRVWVKGHIANMKDRVIAKALRKKLGIARTTMSRTISRFIGKSTSKAG